MTLLRGELAISLFPFVLYQYRSFIPSKLLILVSCLWINQNSSNSLQWKNLLPLSVLCCYPFITEWRMIVEASFPMGLILIHSSIRGMHLMDITLKVTLELELELGFLVLTMLMRDVCGTCITTFLLHTHSTAVAIYDRKCIEWVGFLTNRFNKETNTTLYQYQLSYPTIPNNIGFFMGDLCSSVIPNSPSSICHVAATDKTNRFLLDSCMFPSTFSRHSEFYHHFCLHHHSSL